ncbi:MAG: hypothetical protein ACR2MA_03640 [Egibacteraceae bacterium]
MRATQVMKVVGFKGLVGFKSGLYIGTALGYLLGAKLGLNTGRERYDQFRTLTRSAGRSAPVRQLTGLADRAAQRIEERAGQGVGKVTELVRSSSSRSDSGEFSNGGRPTER